ncbi:MAG: hypothetical protein WCF61_13460 [Terriglobales bacterium]
MNELKTGGMKSNAINKRLRAFRGVIFSIADHRVADGRELSADLILQSRHQFDSYQRSIRKHAFDGISKLGTSRFRISRRAQLLIKPFPPKIVYERTSLNRETAAQHCQVLQGGCMVEKLSNQRIAIATRLRKQQRPGGEAIDAMHNQRSLFFWPELRGKQRQR